MTTRTTHSAKDDKAHWVRPEAGRLYDREFQNLIGWYANRSETEPLRDLVGTLEGKRILDVGCGTGRHLELFQLSNQITGIDQSEEMLALARQKNPHAELHLGSVESLPFDSNTFDVVYSFRVLQHVRDQMQAIREMARVCKVGGTVLVVTYNAWSPLNLYKHLRMSYLGRILNLPFRVLLGRRAFFEPWGFIYDNYCSIPELKAMFRKNSVAPKLSWGITCGMPWFWNCFLIGKIFEKAVPTFFRAYFEACLWCDRHLARKSPLKYFTDLVLVAGEKIT